MRKFVLAATCCLAVAMCAAVLGGCSLFGEKEDNTYYEVSSIGELKDMEGKKNYKLTADIDFNGMTWLPLSVKNFDGQGHTISNAMIIGSSTCAFFAGVGVLKDLTFTDIMVTGTDNGNASYYELAIAAGYASECENITVKGSTANLNITYTQTYGFELSKAKVYGGAIVGHGGSMKNCVAEDCEISVESNSYNELEMGGLVGYTSAIEDCTANNIKVGGKSNSVGNYGGLAGSCTSAKNSVSRECNVVGVCAKSSNPSRVGGFVGYARSGSNSGVTNCASISNTVRFSGESQYTVGGFVGRTDVTVNNCFASDNSITAGITASTSTYTMYAGIFAGSAQAAISRCVAQNSTVSGTTINSAKSAVSGFAASVAASIVKCGTYGNTVSGANACEFANDSSYVKDCIAYTSSDEDAWEDVISALSLDGDLWTMTNGVLQLEVTE